MMNESVKLVCDLIWSGDDMIHLKNIDRTIAVDAYNKLLVEGDMWGHDGEWVEYYYCIY